MRSIMSISMPVERKQELKLRAQKIGKSLSAYIIYALDIEKQLISENQLIKIAKKAEQDYKNNKTKALGSLSDLM